MKRTWRGTGRYEFLINCLGSTNNSRVINTSMLITDRKIITHDFALKIIKEENPQFDRINITNIQYIRRAR